MVRPSARKIVTTCARHRGAARRGRGAGAESAGGAAGEGGCTRGRAGFRRDGNVSRAEKHLCGEGSAGFAARKHVYRLHFESLAADHLAEDRVLGVADEVVEGYSRCVRGVPPDGCAAHGICEVEATLESCVLLRDIVPFQSSH